MSPLPPDEYEALQRALKEAWRDQLLSPEQKKFVAAAMGFVSALQTLTKIVRFIAGTLLGLSALVAGALYLLNIFGNGEK